METNKFYVSAEFSREDDSGWLSFEKMFTNRKEAQEAFMEAQGNPQLIEVTISHTKTFRPK